MQQQCCQRFLYALAPFCFMKHVLHKVMFNQTEKLALISPTWYSNEYVFSYNKLHKGWRKRNFPVTGLYAFPEDSALCVVKCLENISKDLKNGEQRQKHKPC